MSLLQIYAVDSGGRYGYADVWVDLLDEDDNAPYFEKSFFNFALWTQADVGTTAGKLVAKDPDTGKWEKTSKHISFYLCIVVSVNTF